MALTMACTCVMLQNPQKITLPQGQHPTQRFTIQLHNNMTDVANDNNKQMEEEEEESDEDPNLKQAAETQQPSPQPNYKQHISKKKKINQ